MTRLPTGRSPPWRLPAVQDLSPATQTQLKQAQHSLPSLGKSTVRAAPIHNVAVTQAHQPGENGSLWSGATEPEKHRNGYREAPDPSEHRGSWPLSRLHASKQITGLYISHKEKNHEQENWSFQTPGTLKHIFTQMVTDSTPPLSFHTAPEKLALDLQ